MSGLEWLTLSATSSLPSAEPSNFSTRLSAVSLMKFSMPFILPLVKMGLKVALTCFHSSPFRAASCLLHSRSYSPPCSNMSPS